MREKWETEAAGRILRNWPAAVRQGGSMRIYIIRHGETAWNKEKRLQGQTDIALNENGRSLAKVTARALQCVPFDLAYTSPLCRAKETAQLVLNGRAVPICEEPRLREISFGELEGCCFKNEAGEITMPVFVDFFRRPEQYQPPVGGESLDQLCARASEFLDQLAFDEGLQDKTILVSTHGAMSRALLSVIRHSSREDFWDTGVPRNCAVTIAELKKSAAAEGPDWVVQAQDLTYYDEN